MWPSSLFTQRRRRAAPVRRKPASCRLVLEPLEDRTLPSANIDVSNAIHRQEEPAININPINPLNLVVAANDGISAFGAELDVQAYFSQDGGLTWRSSTLPMTVGGDTYTRGAVDVLFAEKPLN